MLVFGMPELGDTNMPLTDTALRNAKPLARPFKLSDGGGMHLLVTPGGSKLWRLAYRFGGKQKTLALGVYPSVTLADARSKRDTAKKMLAGGRDPGVIKKAQKFNTGSSFKAVAEELLGKHEREGRAPRTMEKSKWLLNSCIPTHRSPARSSNYSA